MSTRATESTTDDRGRELDIPTPGHGTPVTPVERRRGVVDRLPGFVRVLLHIRYVFGYLAGGFLVSAPLRFIMDFDFSPLWPSLVVGAAATLLFVMLIPLSQIPWEEMLLPEYKLFELKVLRSSVFACLGLAFVFSVLWGREPDGSSMETFYVNALKSNGMCLIFMIFGYVKVKADTWLFPEFYGLTKKQEEEAEGRETEEGVTSSGFYPARPSKPPPAEPEEEEKPGSAAGTDTHTGTDDQDADEDEKEE